MATLAAKFSAQQAQARSAILRGRIRRAIERRHSSFEEEVRITVPEIAKLVAATKAPMSPKSSSPTRSRRPRSPMSGSDAESDEPQGLDSAVFVFHEDHPTPLPGSVDVVAILTSVTAVQADSHVPPVHHAPVSLAAAPPPHLLHSGDAARSSMS